MSERGRRHLPWERRMPLACIAILVVLGVILAATLAERPSLGVWAFFLLLTSGGTLVAWEGWARRRRVQREATESEPRDRSQSR